MTYVQNLVRQAMLLLGLFTASFFVTIVHSNTASAAPMFEEVVNYEISAFYDLPEEDWGGEVLNSVIADFNNDSFLDIAATYRDNSTISADYNTPAGNEGVVILLNHGDGTFSISSYVPYLENLLAIVAEDFDGDGDQDIVTANTGLGDLAVLLNDGTGFFSEPQRFGEYLDTEKIVVVDIDGDGDSDILATDNDVTNSNSPQGNPGVLIFVNDGYASFTLSSAISDQTLNEDFSPTYVDYKDFAISDFDSDGDIDMILVGGKDLKPAYLIAENQGNGAFSTSSLSLPEEYSNQESTLNKAFPTDIDSDGDTDLLVEASGHGWLIMLNDGLGGFSIIQPAGIGYFDKVVLKDFDLDDDEDLLAANSGTNEFTLLKNDGSGNFTGEVIATTSTGGFTSLHAEDLNNDEKMGFSSDFS